MLSNEFKKALLPFSFIRLMDTRGENKRHVKPLRLLWSGLALVGVSDTYWLCLLSNMGVSPTYTNPSVINTSVRPYVLKNSFDK